MSAWQRERVRVVGWEGVLCTAHRECPVHPVDSHLIFLASTFNYKQSNQLVLDAPRRRRVLCQQKSLHDTYGPGCDFDEAWVREAWTRCGCGLSLTMLALWQSRSEDDFVHFAVGRRTVSPARPATRPAVCRLSSVVCCVFVLWCMGVCAYVWLAGCHH